MAITQQVQRVVDSIDSPEVKLSATEAALLMLSAKNSDVKKAATQTYIALARFGYLLDHSSEDTPTRRRNPLDDGDIPEENLKTLVSKSGLVYFGPMFKSEGEYTSLKDPASMLEELSKNGFEIICLRHLSHPQLDMLFTKILESGIISNSAESIPS